MTLGIIFLCCGVVTSVIFWICLIRGILAKIYKKQFGKGNAAGVIITLVLSMFLYLFSIVSFSYWLATGGFTQVTEGVSYVTAVNMESAKKGWKKGLLKKMYALDFSVEKVCEIDGNYEALIRDASSSDKFRTYEIYMIVENPDEASMVSYSELRRCNIAYARDDADVFIPGFIINHAEFDEIPAFLKWLLPSYRKEQKMDFIPFGRSYLNIRVDVPEGHSLRKVCLADKSYEIDESIIIPFDKDKQKEKNEKLVEKWSDKNKDESQ